MLKWESFATLFNLKLTIVTNLSMLDVCGGPNYASELMKCIILNQSRYALHKNQSFPLRISSVNVTK